MAHSFLTDLSYLQGIKIWSLSLKSELEFLGAEAPANLN